MEIMTFIDEDSHIKELGEKKNNPYLTDFYRKIYFNKSLDLIDHIKISSINEEFIIKFKKIKFHSIYGQFENYPKLIDKLFNGAKNLKEFHNVFKLFYEIKNNIINNELFPRKSRESSLKILKQLFRNNKSINFDINEFLDLFLNIIDVIYEFNGEINRIFISLEENYAYDIISELFKKLLKKDMIISNKKYDFVIQHIVEFLTYSGKINPNENFDIYLLSHDFSNDIKKKYSINLEKK